MKLPSLLLVLAAWAAFAVGCGADKPLPECPYPEDPPLEETDLAPYLEVPEGTSGGEAAAPAEESD